MTLGDGQSGQDGQGFQTKCSRCRRFKVLALLVRAVKRFQASLNPTVSFGRRDEPEAKHEEVAVKPTHVRSLSAPIFCCKSERLSAAAVRGSMGRLPNSVSDGMPPRKLLHRKSTHSTRGHMTAYLLAPLPALKTEA